jgi:Ni2+-binding GTPase involved in maturation of urease and hydrogenase
MRIHLIGGFLGSGKTTAIARACRMLINDGVSTAVIANDQGKYLVDSQYFQTLRIPGAEVTGGCFCCNYDQLDSTIRNLRDHEKPAVIFAEAVGSCTDLIATVLKPLLRHNDNNFEQVTFSTLVDARLLLSFLKNGFLPFDADTTYIWEKQIEESTILLVNKVDLIEDEDLRFLDVIARKDFAGKVLLFQNSNDDRSIRNWLDLLPQYPATALDKSIEIDYNKYGAGEANLAWLDESIEFSTSDGAAPEVAREFILSLTKSLANRQMPVGHLKFMFHNNRHTYKFSYTTVADPIDPQINFTGRSNQVLLVVNARIQASPALLRRTVSQILNALRLQYKVKITESNVAFFAPSFPRPTYRLS